MLPLFSCLRRYAWRVTITPAADCHYAAIQIITPLMRHYAAMLMPPMLADDADIASGAAAAYSRY